MSNEEIIIFGAGFRGEALKRYIGEERVIAYIDNDETKIGSYFCGKPVISFYDYLRCYPEKYVIISFSDDAYVRALLEKNGVYHYDNVADLPNEFYGYGTASVEEGYSYILEYISSGCVLYGLSYLTLFLFEYLKTKGVQNIYIMSEQGVCRQRFDWFDKIFRSSIIRNMDEVCSIDAVITTKRYINVTLDHYKIINGFNISFFSDYYYYPNNEKIRNIHNGRCFIVATGPSLTERDINILHNNNEICFGMNRILYYNSKWTPDYYVCTDRFFAEKSIKEIKAYECKGIFINEACLGYWELGQKENEYKLHVVSEGIEADHYNFSTEIERRIYSGYTVTYACIQLAVYMGFREIYLLGVDCNYIAGSRDNYFIREEKADIINHHTDAMVTAYKSARTYADSHGIKIYNATRGGMLEVFERVDFDSLFNNEEY